MLYIWEDIYMQSPRRSEPITEIYVRFMSMPVPEYTSKSTDFQ